MCIGSIWLFDWNPKVGLDEAGAGCENLRGQSLARPCSSCHSGFELFVAWHGALNPAPTDV